jgi:hypothetical protein
VKPVYPTGKGWVFEIRGTTWYEHEQLKHKEFLRMTLLANLQEKSKSPNAGPAIKDKVSHIFLYNAWRDENNPRPDNFNMIRVSLIDYLMPDARIGPDGNVIASAPGAATPAGGGPQGPAGSQSALSWRPLAPSIVGFAVDTTGAAPTTSLADAPVTASNPYMRTAIPPKAPDTSAPKPTGPDAKGPERKVADKSRFEFVILFIWREDTPSDALVTKPNPTDPTETGLNLPKITTGPTGGKVRPGVKGRPGQ